MAWQPRSTPRSTALATPPAGETWAPMSIAPTMPCLLPDRPLTLPPDELRRLGHRVVDAIVDHWERLPEEPPLRTGTPSELWERLGGPPPDRPGNADAALDRLL